MQIQSILINMTHSKCGISESISHIHFHCQFAKKSENLGNGINPWIYPIKYLQSSSSNFISMGESPTLWFHQQCLPLERLVNLDLTHSPPIQKKDPSLLGNDPQIFYCHHRMGARAIFMTLLHLSQNCMSIISSALGPWTCLILINENITCC